MRFACYRVASCNGICQKIVNVNLRVFSSKCQKYRSQCTNNVVRNTSGRLYSHIAPHQFQCDHNSRPETATIPIAKPSPNAPPVRLERAFCITPASQGKGAHPILLFPSLSEARPPLSIRYSRLPHRQHNIAQSAGFWLTTRRAPK